MPPDSPFARLRASLSTGWRSTARPEQLPPPGDWSEWLILAGRGWGKTRTGSEWVHENVAAGTARRIALVAPTAADVRDIVVEGESGILATAAAHARPEYEPSKRRLTWPNGAVATTYSADEPDRLRGPQHDLAWVDEVGAMQQGQAMVDMLRMGMRRGRPRTLYTTTPRPVSVLIDLLKREGRGVAVTRGRTLDNAANLAPEFIEAITAKYSGTRLGRQELDGELLVDVPGALWQRAWIDADRVATAPDLRRIVVAVDPAVSNNEGSDETGIVVAGVAATGHVYILADRTGRYGPKQWATIGIDAYRHYRADRIIAEVNNGGALVEETLRMVDRSIPYKAVTASRGKVTRAEPVSALYEQRKVHHVGTFTALEDQMCAFTSDFDRSRAGYSPDRVDALVWAVTEVGGVGQPMNISKAAIARFAGPSAWGQARGRSYGTGSVSLYDLHAPMFGRNTK